MLLAASFFDFFSPWIYANYAHTSYQVACGGLLILLTALFKAVIFPIAHHLGTPTSGPTVGRSVSRVYVANIIGATLGPILTGIMLLDIFTTQQCFAICAVLTFMVSMFCFTTFVRPIALLIGLLFAGFTLGYALTQEPSRLIAEVSFNNSHIRRIIENRHGIITIYKGGKKGDIIFGANVYDGRTNLDPLINSNGINRVIILSVLQEKPEHVLIIGLSIGTWLKIITGFPGVKSIDVIEINPGYLEAIKDYPAQESALKDPRVHIYIDDGRRWLKTHPDNKYDLIIMNTTFFWRAYSTNLLSLEFLKVLKKHMNAQAILTYNATGSPDVFKTATAVFSQAYLYHNVIIAADFDWRKKLLAPESIKKLYSIFIDGKPLFPAGSDKLIQFFLTQQIVPFESIESAYKKNFSSRQIEVITDSNLIIEYKYGKKLLAGAYH